MKCLMSNRTRLISVAFMSCAKVGICDPKIADNVFDAQTQARLALVFTTHLYEMIYAHPRMNLNLHSVWIIKISCPVI